MAVVFSQTDTARLVVVAFALPLLHDFATQLWALVVQFEQTHPCQTQLVQVAVLVALAAVSRLLVAIDHCQHWALVGPIDHQVHHREVQH